MKRTFICLLFIATGSLAQAASFDCTKTSTSIENMICSDSQISDLDSQLTQQYKKSLTTSANTDSLKSEQRAWLSTVRNNCQDASCLKQAYADRIEALNGNTNVSTPKDIALPMPQTATIEKNIPIIECSAEDQVGQMSKTSIDIRMGKVKCADNASESATPPVTTAPQLSLPEQTITAQAANPTLPVSDAHAATHYDAKPDSIISDLFQSLSGIIAFMVVIGLIKPVWILRWDKSPSRSKVCGYLFPLGFLFGGIADFTKTDTRKAYELQVHAEKEASDDARRTAKIAEIKQQTSFADGKKLYTYYKVDPGNRDTPGVNEQEYIGGQLLSLCNINGKPRGHYGWIEFRTIFIEGVRMKPAPVTRMYVFFNTDGTPGDMVSGMWRGEEYKQAVINDMKATCD